MTATIYHNPACGTSRNVLAMIRNSGEEPHIIENRDGKFVAPTDAAAQATIAAASDDVPADLRTYLADPNGAGSYPIITLSWLLLHERYRDPVKSAAVKAFVRWGLTDGQSLSGKLGYVPLPAALSGRALQVLAGAS